MHLTEDDLILHYYGEAQGAEADASAHLASCADCRGAFEALRRVMEAVDAAPVPEPGPGFERTVWARLAPALEARPAPSRWSWFSPRNLVFAGGLAAVIVALIVWQIGLPLAPLAPSETLAEADAHRERVLLTAVSDHIEQSELVLVELANAAPHNGDLDVTFERTAADDLVSSGRLYRETALQAGDLQVAELLDELELVLVELARGPEALSTSELDRLREQIDSQELIFKLRALAAVIDARQQSARPTPGPSKRTL